MKRTPLIRALFYLEILLALEERSLNTFAKINNQSDRALERLWDETQQIVFVCQRIPPTSR